MWAVWKDRLFQHNPLFSAGRHRQKAAKSSLFTAKLEPAYNRNNG
jgi:hypothetical protein